MTYISVIKMITSVAVWWIYPSWVNDKLRAWEGFDHSRKFWARLSRDDFRSKLEIISFLSRDMTFSKSFCFPHFWKIWCQTLKLWGFCFWQCLGGLFENSAPSLGIFLRTPTTTTSNFWKFSFFFPKSRCYFPDSYGNPQAEQSTLVMVRQKLKWKLDRPPALVRSSAEEPSTVVAIGTSRVWWSIVQREKKTQRSQCLIVRSLNPSSSTNQGVLSGLFSRPDVTTVLHFAVIVHVNVQL